MVSRSQTGFAANLRKRSAATYAQFFLRSLQADSTVLDCGCGNGTITVGLAGADSVAAVVGIDRQYDGFGSAMDYAKRHRVSGLHFAGGDFVSLPFRDSAFDAVLAHSILEAARSPIAVLGEIRRVLKRGGLIGTASVDYGVY